METHLLYIYDFTSTCIQVLKMRQLEVFLSNGLFGFCAKYPNVSTKCACDDVTVLFFKRKESLGDVWAATAGTAAEQCTDSV